MKLVHTLLFMLRAENADADRVMAERCLKSLEKSASRTVVVCNQGCLSNEELTAYLADYQLDCTVVGDGTNVGIVAGRQLCFTHIFERLPDAEFITELHTDMIFTHNWEAPLVDYLEAHPDEPVISCAITSDPTAPNEYPDGTDAFLAKCRDDRLEFGFTHPCVHRADILRAVGGYDTRFLPGKQAFEDDSLLVGYHYYCGTRMNWRPKINLNSVVYHAVGGQRYAIGGDMYENFHGLVRQYGAMGLKVLGEIHVGPWQKQFFPENYAALRGS